MSRLREALLADWSPSDPHGRHGMSAIAFVADSAHLLTKRRSRPESQAAACQDRRESTHWHAPPDTPQRSVAVLGSTAGHDAHPGGDGSCSHGHRRRAQFNPCAPTGESRKCTLVCAPSIVGPQPHSLSTTAAKTSSAELRQHTRSPQTGMGGRSYLCSRHSTVRQPVPVRSIGGIRRHYPATSTATARQATLQQQRVVLGSRLERRIDPRRERPAHHGLASKQVSAGDSSVACRPPPSERDPTSAAPRDDS